MLWFEAVDNQCFSNKLLALWSRLIRSVGAWIKVYFSLWLHVVFLCSAVYPSSRVFWGDWLGYIWVQTAITCRSILYSQEGDISDHLMLLMCLILKMCSKNFISCRCGSWLIYFWGFSCLWIRKGSSIWTSVLTCFFDREWNVAGWMSLRKPVFPREVWDLEASVGCVPCFLWKAEGRTELGDDHEQYQIFRCMQPWVFCCLLLGGKGFGNNHN